MCHVSKAEPGACCSRRFNDTLSVSGAVVATFKCDLVPADGLLLASELRMQPEVKTMKPSPFRDIKLLSSPSKL